APPGAGAAPRASPPGPGGAGGRPPPPPPRPRRAGWAGSGYCPSHSRYFWGLRLHLICTPTGLPITYALAHPKADERDVARDMLDTDPELLATRAGQILIADKGYASREFETFLTDHDIQLVRPTYKREPPRTATRWLKPFRQIIESINDTLKGQLDLERHGGRTPDGVVIRVLQRLLALTAAVWHNDHTGQPVLRSLTAYDH